jgi:hypothetical protein
MHTILAVSANSARFVLICRIAGPLPAVAILAWGGRHKIRNRANFRDNAQANQPPQTRTT